MKCLAFDTAAGACSAAILADDTIVAARSDTMTRGHTEALIPMLQEVVAEAGLTFEKLDLVGVTVGPGAFTGIRIGLATARGLALAADVPVAGVTTLEALAATAKEEFPAAGRVVAAIDTKRRDYYVQEFANENAAGSTPVVLDIVGLGDLLIAGNRDDKAVLISDAPDDFLADPLGQSGVRRAAATTVDAGTLARLVVSRWHAGSALPPDPVYLRPPEAKLPPRRGLRP